MVVCVVWYSCVFFFKQKTAYEMRISDWSSDVCSSDLRKANIGKQLAGFDHMSDAAFVAERLARDAGVVNQLIADDIAEIFVIRQFILDEIRKIGRASCRERVCQYV